MNETRKLRSGVKAIKPVLKRAYKRQKLDESSPIKLVLEESFNSSNEIFGEEEVAVDKVVMEEEVGLEEAVVMEEEVGNNEAVGLEEEVGVEEEKKENEMFMNLLDNIEPKPKPTFIFALLIRNAHLK